jgi:hypothetical protein
MKTFFNNLTQESGSAMTVALIILALLTIIGHVATRSTTNEVIIASNDTRFKEAFYIADGSTELSSELLEQNIACPTGFNNLSRGNPGLIEVVTNDFWRNMAVPASTPSDVNRDFYISPDPANPLGPGYAGNDPRINVRLAGNTQFSTGSALQVAAGYEGKGKSTAAGGAILVYDQYTQHIGRFRTQSIVRVQWRHVIGTEGTCNP